MPSLLKSTQDALGGDSLGHCTSRALRLTRYARPELKDKTQPTRQNFLKAVVSAKDQRSDSGLHSWSEWLNTVARPTDIIHAKLEARLLINMGGTVLENAGLQLDRFGTAYIPGSAVKACARRTALATLRQWCESGIKPEGDDAFTSISAAFNSPGDLLLAILRVFGCTDLEWNGYDPAPKARDKNDLAWACGDDLPTDRNQWTTLRDLARAALSAAPGCDPKEAKPTRRGNVAFLPAYPIHFRPANDLELDVLTSHHQKYYGSSEPGAVATDTENPVPVFFPSVAAGTIYTFAFLPVGQPNDQLLPHARTWLKTGLELFGLGAKTAAGYGYFSDATPYVKDQLDKEAETTRRAEQEVAAKAKAAAEVLAKKALEAARAAMTPEHKADAELADRAADWGWMKPHLNKFAQHPPTVQAALLRWFAGSGKERWLTEIKPEATKGKKPWCQIIGAIHAAKKIHKIDLP